MDGLMMDYPLTVAQLLDRAALYFPGVEVVSRGRIGRSAGLAMARCGAAPTSLLAGWPGSVSAAVIAWRPWAGITPVTWRRTSACRLWAQWFIR